MVANKRRYTEVTAIKNETGWHILCDGHAVNTPAKHPLCLPNQALAHAVAAEWQAQGEHVQPEAMPLTRLASITLDMVPTHRALLVDDIVQYGETDLLCYRDTEMDLALMQVQHFEHVLDWAYETYGLAFEITDQAAPINQPAQTLTGIRKVVSSANDWELAALAMATPILGSVLLAIALWDGKLNAQQAITAASLDEAFQKQRYGEDPVVAASWQAKQRDVEACETLFKSMASH